MPQLNLSVETVESDKKVAREEKRLVSYSPYNSLLVTS